MESLAVCEWVVVVAQSDTPKVKDTSPPFMYSEKRRKFNGPRWSYERLSLGTAVSRAAGSRIGCSMHKVAGYLSRSLEIEHTPRSSSLEYKVPAVST